MSLSSVVLTIELCCVQEEMGWRSCLPTPWGGGGGSRGLFPLIVSLLCGIDYCAVYRRRWGGGAVCPLPGEEEEGAEDSFLSLSLSSVVLTIELCCVQEEMGLGAV